MEGPSLLPAREQLQQFKGKKIIAVTGNTTIEKERFQGEVVKEIFNWSKHLVFQFPGFALKVHFLMFGTFEADVEGVTVTGDHRRPREPRLAFTFPNGELRMFSCSVQIIEDRNLKKSYDFSVDVLHRHWDPKQAMKAMRQNLDEQMLRLRIMNDVVAQILVGNQGFLFYEAVSADAQKTLKTLVAEDAKAELLTRQLCIETSSGITHGVFMKEFDDAVRGRLQGS